MRWKQFAALALLTGTASAAPMQDRRDLPQLVVALDAAEPLSVGALQTILGITLSCNNDHHCSGGPVTLAGTRIAGVDFRHGEFGSILMLEGLEGSCLNPESIAIDAPFGAPMNGCTDGVLCRYRTAPRRWGNLHLRMPDDPGAPQCVQYVVLNQRP